MTGQERQVVHIVGGGLAGSEAAWQVAQNGVPVVLHEMRPLRSTDAHKTGEFDHLRWGVSQARRAWVTPEVVLNTRSRADLLAWVAGKPGRI